MILFSQKRQAADVNQEVSIMKGTPMDTNRYTSEASIQNTKANETEGRTTPTIVWTPEVTAISATFAC